MRECWQSFAVHKRIHKVIQNYDKRNRDILGQPLGAPYASVPKDSFCVLSRLGNWNRALTD